MTLLAYRHGLRPSELVAVRWDMLDLQQGTFHVVRRKNGWPSVHLTQRTFLIELLPVRFILARHGSSSR
jgi:integrase